MSPFRILRSLIFVGGAALATANASAFAADQTEILRQLTCAGKPNPTPILQGLAQSGSIEVSTGQRQDSSTCWVLKTPMAVDGLSFDHICASSEDPQDIADHPALFWRGPGTSAGTALSLAAPVGMEALKAWAAKTLQGGTGAYTVDESSRLSGESEISCIGYETDGADKAGANTASPTATAIHVPIRGSPDRLAISTAIHRWLIEDHLNAPNELIYEQIRATDRYAYVFAKIRTPDGKPIGKKDWFGAGGCENDPVPGMVEALLQRNGDDWSVIKGNRCADDILIDDSDKAKYGLPAGFTNQF